MKNENEKTYEKKRNLKMKEKKIAIVVTVLIFATILLSAKLKKSFVITPEKAIIGIIKAAGKNNTGKYLTYFCDELRTILKDQRNTMGDESFSRRIMKNYRDLMGVAISDQKEINDNMINVKVELVFEDINEIKSYILKKIGDNWKIKKIISHKNV